MGWRRHGFSWCNPHVHVCKWIPASVYVLRAIQSSGFSVMKK
jgi:hypothetical protein